MALRNIVERGDEILAKKAKEVKVIDDHVCMILDDMLETMRAANGCGLAAPQVGILRRIAVVEVEEGQVYELINPKIIAFSGEQEAEEGCLSIPNQWGITHRPMNVTVRATDRHGNTVEYTANGLLARAFCHEIDHLDGKLFIDIAKMEE